MNKTFTKGLFFIAILIVFVSGAPYAQTITVGAVDPGPYAPGSSISVPISLSGTCITTNTTYSLYLSNAAGSFAGQKLIGTFSNFYATFVNGLIPVGTPAGNGYVVKVVSANPTITSSVSAPFTISAGTAVVAAVASQSISANYPSVFGVCSGVNNTPYSFVNQSTAGATVTATFFNELTKASEGTITPTTAGTSFTANAAHYTVTVKAVNGGIVGTKSYLLINNGVNTSFGVTGNSTICLNGGGSLTYNVDISSPSGIQNNFPGLIYTIKWGDGSTSLLTLCDIIASGGKISHAYTASSCGNNPNGQSNAFEVDLQPSSLYCGKVGTQVTSYAQVVTSPHNSFISPAAACVNTPVTFINNSDPGQDPNSTSQSCQAQNKLYTWKVDGVVVASNYTLIQKFVNTFTTTGIHSVGIHLQNGNPLCMGTDTTINICIQNPPQPKFTLPVTGGCVPLAVTPANQSIIDANCNANNKYVWTVTGPNPVNYANGTNANSAAPDFVFKNAGIYQVQLGITTASCGTITAPVQTITVDSALTVSLSPGAILCGTNQTFSFDPNPGTTQTTILGVGQPQPNTYTWTVTGGAYSFVNGTTANSQYPQITFTSYGNYKITVTVQNKCGTVSKSQTISFQNAPTVKVTPSAASICPGDPVTLTGTITGKYNTFQWVGAGTFSAPGSLTTVYTPTAAEISAGNATVTLDVKTNLAGQCADIPQSITINIFPINTVNSASTAQLCTGNPLNYSITSTAPGSTFSWTASLTSGTATGFANGSGPVIGDILKNNTLADAVVTYKITPQANGCPGTPFTLSVTVTPLSTVSAVPVSNSICTGSAAGINLTPGIAGTTYTWTSTVLTGNITGNSQQPAAAATTAINDILIDHSLIAGTVRYSITPYNGTCPGNPVNVTITVQPQPVISNAGVNDEVCNTLSYTLNGNNPSPGTGLWTVSPAGTVSFNNATLPNATATGLIPGNSYTFTWTITPPAPCSTNSSSVTVIDDAPTIGGTTSGGATVCTGSNGGTITLSGQLGNVVKWETSTDNGVTWQSTLPNNTTASQQYLNLTTTTQYRAVVQNGVCSIQNSTVSTVVVNQPAIQAITGGNQSLCGAATTMLQGNDPSPFTGVWTQTAGPVVTIVAPNSPQTRVNGLVPGNNYTFLWTIKGLPPCADSADSLHVNDANDVAATFTVDKADGCGDYTVNFNNTSSVLTGTSFLWDFGDGTGQSTAVSPSHLFAARTDGKDTSYTVSLYVVNNCFQRPPATLKITVRPQTPVAYISPRQIVGCSPFTLAVDNFSPGNNQSYTYYLYDGSTLVQQLTVTDKNEIRFNPITVTATKQYTLYMVATGFCGNTGQSNVIPITISVTNIIAQMFIQNGTSKGCVPFTTTFVNNSTGADTYYYTIYDVNQTVIDRRQGAATPLPYTFNTPGTYYVTITAANSCSTLESSPPLRVDVFDLPAPQFTADVTVGCRALTVNFTNQTPDDPNIQARSLVYDWDFGDGSHSFSFTPPPHTYSFRNAPFTVTLTATNPVTNCLSVLSKPAYINVTAPPATEFTETPDSVTSIPNYRFSFIDQTTGGPATWNWSFGDGQTSTNQNPGHTYPDTGVYKVTLTTANQSGCDSTISHKVRVTGIPGQLFLPNAFAPNSGTTELKTFMAKGSGIKEWHMQVFNNFSQLVWETTKLDDKGAPVEGWDGTFKGAPAPQGVYIWQVSATFINGTKWKGNVIDNSLPKRVGVIHLIR